MSATTSPLTAKRLLRIALLAALAAALLYLFGARLTLSSSGAEEARALPAPAVDEPAGLRTTETIVLAGGCFWGVQGVFQHVQGVRNAVSGYAGGAADTADYEMVSTGTTGHAESVAVTFDPHEVTLGQLLQVYFSVAHDPTELDRQGPDTGPQYRSAIFPTNPEQASVAAAYIAQLDAAGAFDAAIVTKIEPDRAFYPAETYHQDFLERNPMHPYIVRNDLPKIENLKRLFPALYRADPVLVAATGATN